MSRTPGSERYRGHLQIGPIMGFLHDLAVIAIAVVLILDALGIVKVGK